MEWLEMNIFKKSKDAKKLEKNARKLEHLSQLAPRIQSKDELRYKFEEVAIQTLKRASEYSKDWTPGVNLTNILCAAFACAGPESVNNTVKSSVSLYAFGICGCKSCT